MAKALEVSSSSAATPLAAAAVLLAQGGDARLTIDPTSGLNKYGCAATPVTSGLDFASSTASTISPAAFAAAEAERDRLARSPLPPAAAYAEALDRLRRDLIALNGLEAVEGLDIAFAASGTDLHLLAAAMVGGDAARPLTCVCVEPEETGSGVRQALAGRHFSDRTPLGGTVAQGEPAGAAVAEVVAVPARDGEGGLRDGAEIEAELDALALAASRAGRRLLLVAADVSKTGLIAPGLAAVTALRRRFPRTVEVLVDACQFRLAPASLRAYLDAGLMVAVTGSKFLTGPTFSGALFAPRAAAGRMAVRLPGPPLGLYAARAEWPAAWLAGRTLPEAANPGLLLRWRAALTELSAFRALPEPAVAGFLAAFADAVETRLAVDPRLEPLAGRPLDRRAIGAPGGWDLTPTIFPFRLRAGPRGRFLSAAETQAAYRALQAGGVRLGQPVGCGERDGAPAAALRLCASARLAVEALEPAGPGPEAVIARAMAALDAAADACA